MVTVRRGRVWRSAVSSRAAPSAAVRPAAGYRKMQRIAGVELRDGQLPEVLVQMACAELPFRHQRGYGFIEGPTVDDGE